MPPKPQKILSIVRSFTATSAFPTIDPQLKKLIGDNVLGQGISPQKLDSNKFNEFAGELLGFETIRYDKDQYLTTFGKSDIKKSKDIVFSPGLGGGENKKRLEDSLLILTHFKEKSGLLAYSPLDEGINRKNRFNNGLPYYQNPYFINETESNNFFDKVLKSKFFNADGTLKTIEEIDHLTLSGYSIGHRENISHINYLIREFRKIGLKDEEIDEYLEKISLINIGSPVNWTVEIQDDHPIQKLRIINIRSQLDFGTAKPIEDFNNFHNNPDFRYDKLPYFQNPNNPNEVMFVLTKDIVGDNFDLRTKGHDLNNYMKVIASHPELQRVVTSVIEGKKPILSSKSLQLEFNTDKSQIDYQEIVDRMSSIFSKYGMDVVAINHTR